MTGHNYDAIIIGSGAGGSACAYNLVQAGKRVLLLEKGGHLPRDGSTLDVKLVFGEERFKNRQPWTDNRNRKLRPGEYYNVGGKTKWYGAALLRFGPHEFNTDPNFQCPGWPISYADLEPFYSQADSRSDMDSAYLQCGDLERTRTLGALSVGIVASGSRSHRDFSAGGVLDRFFSRRPATDCGCPAGFFLAICFFRLV